MKQLRRRLSRQELEEAAALADRIFREEGEPSMGTSFPRIFDPSIGLSLGIVEDGRLVSFIGFVPHQIRIGPALLSACALGSVCTDPDYRGQGHASVLLHEAFHRAERMEAALMLVSGTRSLYRRNGCYAFGSVRRYRIDGSPGRPQALPPNLRVRPMDVDDWFRLKALADAKPAGYLRSIPDFASELASEAVAAMYGFHHEVYVAEAGEQLLAYVVIAAGPIPPGSDLEPFVVEWGGKADRVLPLAREAMRQLGLSSLLLFASAHERRMMDLLEGHPYTSSHNQGTVRIMNLPLLWSQLQPYFAAIAAAAGGEIPDWTVERLAEDEHALVLDGRLIPLSARDWTLLLFDGPDAEPDDGPDAFVRQQAEERRLDSADPLPALAVAAAGGTAEAESAAAREAGGAVRGAGSARPDSSGSPRDAEAGRPAQAGSESGSARHLPLTDAEAGLLRSYFPLPFPYTAGLSYI
ncbi:GNAT family N-acetyltransferase [Paenibacillus albicereus]|uniref:GNAT family N-acetyltransferase n=1 Tax=Paenibacillus albicereus TaxID=2726185 RepID=A0A6H2GTW7_9BACL|nr:GNAT family N-acetyltransferase [Paenibacillus albicereus]QJC50873.1 GNAT family N-acetyltransferase [Paenibacillus albicereus]